MDLLHLRVQAQGFSQRPLRLDRFVHFLIDRAQDKLADGGFGISPQTFLNLDKSFREMVRQQENISKVEVSLGIALIEPDSLFELVLGRGKIGLGQVGATELIVRGIETRSQYQRFLEVTRGALNIAIASRLQAF